MNPHATISGHHISVISIGSPKRGSTASWRDVDLLDDDGRVILSLTVFGPDGFLPTLEIEGKEIA